MTDRDQTRKELQRKRSELRDLYIKAKNKNDDAEMSRLVALAGEIDDLLDDLVFMEIQEVTTKLAVLAEKIQTAKDRATSHENFIPEFDRVEVQPVPRNNSLPNDMPTEVSPSSTTTNWSSLIAGYRIKEIEFPNLKPVTLAQWILESGRGTSTLARKYNNYAGIKWRTQMQPFGQRVRYAAHDGSAYYTHFNDINSFINGFWAFLDRSPYNGWRNQVTDAETFIEFVGPIWAEDPRYVDKVLDLLPEAEGLLLDNFVDAESTSESDGSSHVGGLLIPGRPSLELDSTGKIVTGSDGLTVEYLGVDNCPYGRDATRNKRPFSAIVIHHTTDSHDAEWYVQYQIDGDQSRGGHFGYHFYIAKNGEVYQGAPMSKRTNHVSPKRVVRYDFGLLAQNTTAIGISCVGAWNRNGFNPTAKQKERINDLVFALADLYSVPFSNVYGHGEIQSNRKKVEGTILAQKIREW